jgi:hypothetical protein
MDPDAGRVRGASAAAGLRARVKSSRTPVRLDRRDGGLTSWQDLGMTLITMLLLALSAIQPAAAVQKEKGPNVRVYVFTSQSASGEHTDEEKGRLEAVDEMRGALKKKKGLAIVDDRSQADVLVEVLGREQRDAPSGGFGGKTITAMGDTIIRVHVSRGEEQADLKGIGQGTFGRAAKDAAERITKWIARRETTKTGEPAIRHR